MTENKKEQWKEFGKECILVDMEKEYDALCRGPRWLVASDLEKSVITERFPDVVNDLGGNFALVPLRYGRIYRSLAAKASRKAAKEKDLFFLLYSEADGEELPGIFTPDFVTEEEENERAEERRKSISDAFFALGKKDREALLPPAGGNKKKSPAAAGEPKRRCAAKKRFALELDLRGIKTG